MGASALFRDLLRFLRACEQGTFNQSRCRKKVHRQSRSTAKRSTAKRPVGTLCRPAPFRMVFKIQARVPTQCRLQFVRSTFQWGHQRCSEIYLDFCEPASLRARSFQPESLLLKSPQAKPIYSGAIYSVAIYSEANHSLLACKGKKKFANIQKNLYLCSQNIFL